jgi:hypothetical protein
MVWVMEVVNFELEVMFEGNSVLANVQKFQAIKVPQYRVAVPGRERKFCTNTFYETAPSEFFWCKLQGDHERWARAVSRTLVTYIEDNPAIKKKGIKAATTIKE